MTVLAIVLIVILFIVSWILLMPLVIDVDTARTSYRVYQTGTFLFSFEKDFKPRLRVMGLSVPISQHKQKKAKAKSLEKKKNKISIHRVRVLIRKIFQSICIKQFHVDIDTDNVVLNAQLIPALVVFSRGPVQLSVNFEGRVYARLLAEVRLYRLAWAFLEFFTKNKYYGHEF